MKLFITEDEVFWNLEAKNVFGFSSFCSWKPHLRVRLNQTTKPPPTIKRGRITVMIVDQTVEAAVESISASTCISFARTETLATFSVNPIFSAPLGLCVCSTFFFALARLFCLSDKSFFFLLPFYLLSRPLLPSLSLGAS